jgi:hypothetical protein
MDAIPHPVDAVLALIAAIFVPVSWWHGYRFGGAVEGGATLTMVLLAIAGIAFLIGLG